MNEISFRTLGLGPKILQAVDDAGYTIPTSIQHTAIPHVLQGRDLIGIAQTGTGKTAAFVLPLLEMIVRRKFEGSRPCALIVAPTRELAMQIDESVRTMAKHLRVRCANVFGGVNERPQIDALRRGADIVVATPGRLLDLMKQGHASLKHVRYVVLDEADRMLDMGFLPQIRRIINALPRDRQTLLFSATLSRDIEKIASEMLRHPKMIEIGRRANPVATVTQFLYPVSKQRKLDLLLNLLRDSSLDSVLVFSRTKHGADKIARKLTTAGIQTAAIHSNRSQSQRVRALEAFRGGKVRVLVATDIAARGIDVEGISHVINFDFPMHPEDYVHRIGRTGRMEAIGDAISFVSIEDGPYVHALEKMIGRRIERRTVAGFDQWGAAVLSGAAPVRTPAPHRSRGRARVW
ncbi:MAG TPA: DEAD/DEAH box helicase [Thermoanaerobaculia bacterium]|nr:DEAD/DEAH box helicase [Thermoanaerobaculia bacterium]